SRRARRDRARRWRCRRRGGRARLCPALEAAGPARAHRPSAAGDGLQRHSGAPRGGRDMTDNEETITATIDGAEEVRDPLEGLVEKTKIDPGASFMPEVLAALAALKRDDRAAFETLRAQLKAAGCRVTALDEALADASDERGLGHKPTQADILLGLAQAAELFHTADGTGFADIDIDGHRETWPVRSKSFRRWLVHRFFAETNGAAPTSKRLRSPLHVVETKATHFDAPRPAVPLRSACVEAR